jgi:ABC-2 type transport system permease protein
MMRALRAELGKLKRARMPLWTVLVLVGYTLVMSVFGVALTDPQVGAKLGASGGAFTQAAAQGLYRANWENYLRFNFQGIAGSWGLLVFGLIVAYVFGREYSEGTAKNMLTLPIRREWFALAKMSVVALWVLALTLLSVVLQVVSALLLDLPGFSWAIVRDCLGKSLLVSLLIFLTLPVVAVFSTLGKGYLPPMGFTITMMLMGTGLAMSKLAPWFPWNMPTAFVGASWLPIPMEKLQPGSWLVAAATFVLGMAVLLWRTNSADNAQ